MTGRVLLGAVIGPHGIKGEVRVKTFTLNPENLGLYGALATKSGRRLNVAAMRATKAGEAIVAFEGIDDRNAAEALAGEELYVERAALPKLEAGEFYGADLIGLKVEDRAGKHLGKVHALHNFGAGDMIEIELLDGKTELIPVSADTIHAIDLALGRVVVQLPPETDEP